jgi:hypothetical protein
MGRKYQSHNRYKENFVTLVEFIFDDRHLSSSSIGGGADTLFELQENRLKRSCCPDNLFNDMSSVAVNALTGKESKHLQVLI